jgi:hypothetical protein
MNYKVIIMSLYLVSCKQDKLEFKSENNKFYDSLLIHDKEYTEIVKQNNEYKLSCANPQNYNHVKLTNKILHLEIIEPIDYEIDKMKYINGKHQIYLKNENFYYKVINIDGNLGITYWQNISNNKVNEDLSFYAIENLKLKSVHLKKEICNSVHHNEPHEIFKSWNGDYYFKTKVESIGSDTQIDMTYFINIDNNKAILSINANNPNEVYCEGDYLVTKKNEFIHLIHNGESGICTDNLEDSSFDIKKEGTQYYIRSKRFIDFAWKKLEKNDE